MNSRHFLLFIVLLTAFPAFAQNTPPHVVKIKVGIPYVTRDQYKPVVGKYGGQLVRDSLGEPKSFNPITAGETSSSDYTGRIFAGLTDVDPWTSQAIPSLAESWTTSADGLVWTFKLRKELVFNDNTPLTADDVAFTWNDLIYDLSRPAGSEPRWPCSTRDIADIRRQKS